MENFSIDDLQKTLDNIFVDTRMNNRNITMWGGRNFIKSYRRQLYKDMNIFPNLMKSKDKVLLDKIIDNILYV